MSEERGTGSGCKHAPPAAPAGAGAVATGPIGSEVDVGSSLATEGIKASDNHEAGKKTFSVRSIALKCETEGRTFSLPSSSG